MRFEMKPGWGSIALPLTCPNCGEENSKTLAWLNENSEFVCTGCDGLVTLQDEQFRDIEKSIKELLKQSGIDFS